MLFNYPTEPPTSEPDMDRRFVKKKKKNLFNGIITLLQR